MYQAGLEEAHRRPEAACGDDRLDLFWRQHRHVPGVGGADALDGLGRLAYESAIQRDYPVVFGTLYVFGLLGLVVGLLSDLTYVWVDPRIDFESRET